MQITGRFGKPLSVDSLMGCGQDQAVTKETNVRAKKKKETKKRIPLFHIHLAIISCHVSCGSDSEING